MPMNLLLDLNAVLTITISLLALLVTYAVFKSNQKPQIIVFATPHYGKASFIQLNVKNIGNGIAENVIFSSNQPIPRRAFGISKLQAKKEIFENGIFKHGVRVFPPNYSYIYDWGQFGGLKEALNDEIIIFKVSYLYKHPLNLWKSKHTDISIIDIRELEALPSTTGDTNDRLNEINKTLEKINLSIKDQAQ
ncbi:hypothetical protein [Acinetobacter proteolyticus]|jgi:hypothetical protein|uniref:hypothetical protein n=1 Tax=Acinetobacter proteolyticus TaxID=1776741 RepID=UPI0031CECD67